MKKKLIMVDYIGNSSEDGNPIGHPIKVALDNKKLLDDFCKIEYLAPNNSRNKLNFDGKGLPYYAIRGKSGFYMLIRNYWIELLNLHKVLKVFYESNTWFYNTDYVLFLWLIFRRKSKNKVLCSTYVNIPEDQLAFVKKIKKLLIRLASKKIDLLIYSNKDFNCKYTKTIYMPDFLYDSEKYSKYNTDIKKSKVISLGTISEGNKEIIEMIEAFNESGYPLEIVGKFYDEDLYHRALNIKKNNVIIRNEFINDDLYCSLLAESKYSILPYREAAYKHKTSSVILESVFLKAIPIAPQFILDKNEISGIGYNSISELSKINLDYVDCNKYNYNELIKKKYLKAGYSEQLKIFLERGNG
ncbi:hypothetical protein [Murimonas intestini]|uniref:Glycosyltransferase family 1 protein n=1 Tax=Murimonas intestini TaxID=1337051 RepID=A0AB73T936_9FIRM|nr:hypothetical protein [Murimonas intestini]MCR1839491.1 hypothetical protein [Murimonas intestini]MCR1867966.1 hypothetical protein [Murimonas intestini]MCR1882396.1 hypothetical protein [Murimonas intestini]